jgi:hypothetical protein
MVVLLSASAEDECVKRKCRRAFWCRAAGQISIFLKLDSGTLPVSFESLTRRYQLMWVNSAYSSKFAELGGIVQCVILDNDVSSDSEGRRWGRPAP